MRRGIPTFAPARSRLWPAIGTLARATPAFLGRERAGGWARFVIMAVVVVVVLASAAVGSRLMWAAPWLRLEMVPNPEAAVSKPAPQGSVAAARAPVAVPLEVGTVSPVDEPRAAPPARPRSPHAG